MKHFFISYTNADRSWAEWIAWQLEAAGYSTVLQAWDFPPGSNFVLQMQKATLAERTIAVLSPDYLTSRFTQAEWAAAFAHDPLGEKATLIPVRVRECDVQGLLPQIIYIDLVDRSEAGAQEVLLAGLQSGRAKPIAPPEFPGDDQRGGSQPPHFPGTIAHNPFHTAGPLPAGASTYVERPSDQELQSSLAEHSLIAVYGDYEVGKSSLLTKMHTLLSAEWTIFIKDLNALRPDHETLLIAGFFRMVSQSFGPIETWEDLATSIQQQPSIFLLDELGTLSPAAVTAFIPRLHWLAGKAQHNVRIVVTLHEPIPAFLRSRGLQNRRYLRDWKLVHVSAFDQHAVQKLLRFLPEPIGTIASRHQNEILARTAGNPRRIQCLCATLFEQSRTNQAEDFISQIIRDDGSYE